MVFNLMHDNGTHERIGYFVYTTGVDREGNEWMMVVKHDPSVSGCNPYYWSISPYNYYGHEFSSKEEAEQQAKYAGGSWSVKSYDKDAIKIAAVKFTVVKNAVEIV